MNCSVCKNAPAAVRRSSSRLPYCKRCFTDAFEEEVYRVIEEHQLIVDGDVLCIGVSGGKDSSVLAHVLATLKERYNRKWTLYLLAADEGIRGYRDDSLNVVLNMSNPNYDGLKILNFKERFGFTMDEVVSLIGKKNNCTVCGTFRRQILEIGARLLGANKLCTGHNIDDNAETVLLNICRNDLFKLAKNINEHRVETEEPTTADPATAEGALYSKGETKDKGEFCHKPSVLHGNSHSAQENAVNGSFRRHPESSCQCSSDMQKSQDIKENCVTHPLPCCEDAKSGQYHINHLDEILELVNSDLECIHNPSKTLKRIKPMMYCFEKEIVLYARYKRLEYFSTECIYAPEAYRGFMRTFIKQLEAVDPRIIENITSSSEHFYADYPVGRKMKTCISCGIEGINDVCKACITVDNLSSLRINRKGERILGASYHGNGAEYNT